MNNIKNIKKYIIMYTILIYVIAALCNEKIISILPFINEPLSKDIALCFILTMSAICVIVLDSEEDDTEYKIIKNIIRKVNNHPVIIGVILNIVLYPMITSYLSSESYLGPLIIIIVVIMMLYPKINTLELNIKRAMEERKITMQIKIKYFSEKIEKIKKIEKGNWIDLRAAEDVVLKKGEFKLIPLGIGLSIPRGWEAIVSPRSSTFKNFGIIQTNSIGVIDGPDRKTGEGGYCGNNDQWFMPVLAIRDTEIHVNDRICQFRIQEQQPEIEFEEVEYLEGPDRGGHGSTGKN